MRGTSALSSLSLPAVDVGTGARTDADAGRHLRFTTDRVSGTDGAVRARPLSPLASLILRAMEEDEVPAVQDRQPRPGGVGPRHQWLPGGQLFAVAA